MKFYSREQAIELLLQGGVGVLATDTVYGVVARAADKRAVARLYALKQRARKPGTVIAASAQQLVDFGVAAHHVARVGTAWPGPLSVETPLGASLNYLHQGTGRQGFRVVADERIRAVLERTGPLVTSSANHPGKPPAETAHQAHAYFGDEIDFYVDDGDRHGAAPSTIIALHEDGSIEVFRHGAADISHLQRPAGAAC